MTYFALHRQVTLEKKKKKKTTTKNNDAESFLLSIDSSKITTAYYDVYLIRQLSDRELL